ncbi:MAG: hypothetical protein V4590_01020 [Bacteroidota bacterium]
MQKKQLVKTVLLCVITVMIVSLQSCCKCCTGGDGSDGFFADKYEYEHIFNIGLVDSTDIFQQVIFPGHQLTEFPDTNTMEWKWFLDPPQTIVYIQTKKGWDTLIYEIIQTIPEYTDPECGTESISMSIKDPVLISHTFDSAYIQTKVTQVTSTGSLYDYKVTTTRTLQLK